MTTQPDWVRRFTATSLGFPSWDDGNPDHLAVVSNRGGGYQVWAHDLADGSWRQASEEPVGVEVAWMLPGDRIAWWRDTTGDERGMLVAAPFAGGEPAPVFPEIPEGWLMGHSFAAGRAAISVEVDGRYRTYLIDADGATRELFTYPDASGVGSAEPGAGGGLSADGTLLCVRHAEHGDILHSALRVFDLSTSEPIAELEDKGRNLDPATWSPVPGDQRLAFTSEQGPFERPAIWDVRTGMRRDLELDLPGGAFPVRWFPDASSLLVRYEHEGASQLLHVDVDTASGDTAHRARGRYRGRRDPAGRIDLVSDDRLRAPGPDRRHRGHHRARVTR